MENEIEKRFDVRISEKPTLSIYEASAYTGIGTKKLAKMAQMPNCEFVLYVGSKRMFKRQKLVEYLESHYSI